MVEYRGPVALLALGTVLVQVPEGRWFGARGFCISAKSWPRSGAGKARVAVARKLAVLLHHLWITGQNYQSA